MRAIDGDRLKRKAQKVATEAWKMKIEAKVETVLNQFIDWIDEAPTIEPERKRGEWIPCGGSFRCSECSSMPEFKDIRRLHFCPNCGADMRGEQHE